MIRKLALKDVGPARELKFSFAPRLNVLTGDNGLGKAFVLDVLWFAFELMPRAHRVKVEKLRWRARGDVSNWLSA